MEEQGKLDLEVFSEVSEAVSLGELQLDTGKASQGSGKACQALLAAATDPHQQGVASGLAQHPGNAGNVVHCILEEDQPQGLAAAAVVLGLEALQGLHQLGMVTDLHTHQGTCQRSNNNALIATLTKTAAV